MKSCPLYQLILDLLIHILHQIDQDILNNQVRRNAIDKEIINSLSNHPETLWGLFLEDVFDHLGDSSTPLRDIGLQFVSHCCRLHLTVKYKRTRLDYSCRIALRRLRSESIAICLQRLGGRTKFSF